MMLTPLKESTRAERMAFSKHARDCDECYQALGDAAGWCAVSGDGRAQALADDMAQDPEALPPGQEPDSPLTPGRSRVP